MAATPRHGTGHLTGHAHARVCVYDKHAPTIDDDATLRTTEPAGAIVLGACPRACLPRAPIANFATDGLRARLGRAARCSVLDDHILAVEMGLSI